MVFFILDPARAVRMALTMRIFLALVVGALSVVLANSNTWWISDTGLTDRDVWLGTAGEKAAVFLAISAEFLIASLFLNKAWKLTALMAVAFIGPAIGVTWGIVWNLAKLVFGGGFSLQSIHDAMNFGIVIQAILDGACATIVFLSLETIFGPRSPPAATNSSFWAFSKYIRKLKIGVGGVGSIEVEIGREPDAHGSAASSTNDPQE